MLVYTCTHADASAFTCVPHTHMHAYIQSLVCRIGGVCGDVNDVSGHAVGKEGMAGYVRSVVLEQHRFEIVCPAIVASASSRQILFEPANSKCGRPWPFNLVCLVSGWSVEERKLYSTTMSTNYCEQVLHCRQCPRCSAMLLRASKQDRACCVVCAHCFCWACRRPWLPAADAKACGNPDCRGYGSVAEYLRSCPPLPGLCSLAFIIAIAIYAHKHS